MKTLTGSILCALVTVVACGSSTGSGSPDSATGDSTTTELATDTTHTDVATTTTTGDSQVTDSPVADSGTDAATHDAGHADATADTTDTLPNVDSGMFVCLGNPTANCTIGTQYCVSGGLTSAAACKALPTCAGGACTCTSLSGATDTGACTCASSGGNLTLTCSGGGA